MKTLLLTGDDGYNALGVRLLAQIFKTDYEVTIVASKVQKSGAGGSVKAYGSKEWGMETIDGIDAYWVEGTPADAMEFAQGYFKNGFDYLISGINIGENIGLSTITASGTGGAAIRALTLGIAPRVIIMSWMQTSQDSGNWARETKEEVVANYLEYPGKAVKFIFEEIINNDYFGKKLINVNFPANPTRDYKVTKLLQDLTKFYKYPVIVSDNTFAYGEQVYNYTEETKSDISTDVGALLSGYISVTPFVIE